MKTQKIISITTLSMALLIATLFTFVSCNGQQENSEKENIHSSNSQNSVKAPSVDIHTATFMGNIEAVGQHIKAGTDLNQKDAYGSSPIIIASTFGKTEVALLLIEGGADLNGKNNDGSTPLHIAAFFCREEIVKALLAKGADKTIRNNAGSTALESVTAPFESVKGIYDQISKDLGPLGFKLDYKQLESTRPKIAEMLR